MGKLFNFARSRLGRVVNAPSSGSAINRDPKANKVKRVGFQSVLNGGGRDNLESPEVDLARVAAAIERDAYLSQAHLKYSELVVKQGFSLKTKDQSVLDYLNQRFKMMEIATGQSLNVLVNGIASDIVKFGNAFLVKARAKGGIGLPPGLSVTAMPPSADPVAGYFLVPAESITIARDKNGEILLYQQEVEGQDKPLTFKQEDMVHIAWNRTSGKAFGFSFFGSVLEDVLILRTIEQNVNLLTRRFTFPLVKYRVGVGAQPASDEDIEEVRQEIDGADIDSIYVMPGGHDMEGVTIPTIDMSPYLKHFEERVFSGLGLSAVDFGRGDTANRNTADAMGGIKTDRVKSFARTIGIEFTRQIIEELLVEGGFDPFANPDYAVELVFNEIEMEALIKRETHEIFKFEHNAQTFEEMRLAIGKDPMVDESRLNRFIAAELASQQAAEKEAAAGGGSSETDNKQTPENQSGKRSGPKKATESFQYTEQTQQVMQGETAVIRLQRASDWFSELEALALKSVHESAQETGHGYDKELAERIQWVVEAPKDGYLKRIHQGDTHVTHMMELHRETVISRAKWYGYALAHFSNGCERFKITADQACSKCAERDGEEIHFIASKENGYMLLSHVPPFHPGGKSAGLEAIY